MKSTLSCISKLKSSHRVLLPLLSVVLAVLLLGGIVLAATMVTKTVPGTIKVVEPSGGSGGGGTGGATYNFRVVAANDVAAPTITSIDWNVPKTGSATATVYLINTGTGALSVAITASLPDGMTLTSVGPISLPVSPSPVSVSLTVNYGSSTLDVNGTGSVNITFTGDSV